jgi:hypothetical protein
MTGREIRFRKTCKTEVKGQIELGKLLARPRGQDGKPIRHYQVGRTLPSAPAGIADSVSRLTAPTTEDQAIM